MDVRKIPKASGDLPTGSLNASLTKLMASVNTGRPADLATLGKAEFIPANTFEGKRAGYVFASGDKGIGYYIDKDLSREEREAVLQKQKEREQEKGKSTSAVLDAEELLKQAEEATHARTVLDARSLKKLISAFDKKYKENLDQRMKHPNTPERFMESEVDLDDALQDLFQVVNVPELYPTLCETGVIDSLLHLLGHENKDIAADVIQLLASLTDTTDNEEWMKPFQTLVSCLTELNAVGLLIQQLEQLIENTDEEATTVFNLLTALDNMIDVLPSVAKQASENKQFVNWLLMRLSRVEFDSVKQICGEMLVELLQYDARSVLEMNGLDMIVRMIQSAASSEVKSDDELETTGNLFDALCCCILVPDAKDSFIQSGGVELSLNIIKKKKDMRISALRVVEFATTKSPSACRRLLDAFGLKTIFAFFMKKLATSTTKDVELEQKAEEMVLTIVSNLLEELEIGAGHERVAAKFVENEFEKCDRLLECYYIYHARVIAVESEFKLQPVDDVEELMSLKLSSGLATLQHVCLIICHLWASGDKALRQRLLLLLHQKGHTLLNVKSVVVDMMEMIGGTEEDQQRRQFRRLISCLDGDSATGEEETVPPPAAVEHNPEQVPASLSKPKPITKDELKERIASKRKSKRQKTDN